LCLQADTHLAQELSERVFPTLLTVPGGFSNALDAWQFLCRLNGDDVQKTFAALLRFSQSSSQGLEIVVKALTRWFRHLLDNEKRQIMEQMKATSVGQELICNLVDFALREECHPVKVRHG
jgi:hypothetical protein